MNLYPHRIRLRGPWEYQLAAAGRSVPRRVTMPCHWRDLKLGDAADPVLLRRRFGFPGRIDTYERVWLTFDETWHAASVQLNGTPLGALKGHGEFEVTALLRERNELTVDGVALDQEAPWGEVALEVRCAAHLADIDVTARPAGATVTLDVRGTVVGTANGLLELYVVLDRSNVAYDVAQSGPFHFTATDLKPAIWRQRAPEDGTLPLVRIDLVHGASIWYRWEREVPLLTIAGNEAP